MGITSTPCWYCLKCDHASLHGAWRPGARHRCRRCLTPMQFTMRPDRIPGASFTRRILSGSVLFMLSLGRSVTVEWGVKGSQPRRGH